MYSTKPMTAKQAALISKSAHKPIDNSYNITLFNQCIKSINIASKEGRTSVIMTGNYFKCWYCLGDDPAPMPCCDIIYAVVELRKLGYKVEHFGHKPKLKLLHFVLTDKYSLYCVGTKISW
jgi:hypothetical protein